MRYLLCVLLGLANTMATADPMSSIAFDHYNPVLLNEQALGLARNGNTASARILLERALRIAPHDERIRHNLDNLRAWQTTPNQTDIVVNEMDMEGQAATTAAGNLLVSPPELWPLRQ